MRKAKMTLKEWCENNGKEALLFELDNEKNKKYYPFADSLPFDSTATINWIGSCGHSWEDFVIARTLFSRGCPICNPNTMFPAGTKYGCVTILEGYSRYPNEAAEELGQLSEKNEEFRIRLDKAFRGSNDYKCQCKCGRRFIWDERQFLSARHRYCTAGMSLIGKRLLYPVSENELCGLWVQQKEKRLESFQRVYSESYYHNYTGSFHESLEILECVNDRYEELTSYTDIRKKHGGVYTVYKQYRCRCYLCGKERIVKSSDFYIKPPSLYGIHAYDGYYSGAKCDCHPISSFQWIVNKILVEYGINYRVEYSFSDLTRPDSTYPLSFDFCVFDDVGNIKCLIECQGEQHYHPVDQFGGEVQFARQKENDALKREYAKAHGMQLLEISYTQKKYETIENLLSENGILQRN